MRLGKALEALLIEYANEFHHENWQAVVINDLALTGFARRTLSFIARP